MTCCIQGGKVYQRSQFCGQLSRIPARPVPDILIPVDEKTPLPDRPQGRAGVELSVRIENETIRQDILSIPHGHRSEGIAGKLLLQRNGESRALEPAFLPELTIETPSVCVAISNRSNSGL